MPKSAHSSPSKPDAQRGPVTRSQSRTTPNSEDLAASLLSRTRQRKKMAGEEKNGILPSESASHVTVSGADAHLDIPAGPMRPRVPSGASAELKRKRQLEDEELDRRSIVLWWSPFRTTYYFLLECIWLVREYGTKFVRSRLILPFALVSALIFTAYSIQGPHQPFVSYFERKILYCLYWIGLGVLSSIGLGTGLHTFILYLGPHIASVTLAAYECGTLKFPQPPYPDEILCPESETLNPDFVPSLWNIMSKVRLESFMWGLGTAIGELPPYFMARAARLSGKESEELVELQALLEDKQDNLPLGEGTLNLKRQRWRSFIQRRVRRATLDLTAAGTPVPEISIVERKVQPSFMDRGKIFMEQLVARVGFFGILLGASIPNPLFDLAGITCGHFLVPFSTFFGATLIGKAVIKMHIQMIFVIITFSEKHVEHIIRLLKHIPKIGPHLQQPFLEFLQKQKTNLHRKPGSGAHHTQQSWLQWAFEKLVIVMVVYFVLSIVNSLAQSYHRRITKANQKPVYVAPKGKLQE